MVGENQVNRSTAQLRLVDKALGESRWYVAKTQPRKEVLAEQHLKRQNFETFLPYAPKTLTSKKNKAANLRQPLFPGYIFVKIDLGAQRWRAINSTIGVLYLIQFTDKPSPMPIGATETMIEQTDKTGQFKFADNVKPGDEVRVIGGPMHDFIGKLISVDGKGRSMVLLEFMNRKINTVIPEDRLMKTNFTESI